MKKALLFSLAVLGLSLCGGLSVHAQQAISVNFTGEDFSSDGDPSELVFTDIAGVVPVANWNNADGTGAPVFGTARTGQINTVSDSNGDTANSVSIVYGATDERTNNLSDPNSGPTGDEKLLNGYLAGSPSVTVTGLTGGYDLYVYFLDGSTTTATYTYQSGAYVAATDTFVGTGTPLTMTGTLSPTFTGFTAGTNYVEFSGLAASTFQVSSADGPINGLEIVAAAPEPSAVVALPLGAVLLGLIVVRRHSLKARA